MAARVAPGPDLYGALREAAREHRCVFIAGLPGTGKSLVIHHLAGIAADLGRTAHLVQWDVARLPFDRPDVLARYPEVDGVTHAAIRVAAGRWARRAARRWHAAHPDPQDLLIGETPLIGGRFMDLARPQGDAIEALLASEATIFLVPVPSREVRRVIEEARAREITAPVHARDAASAPPHLVRSHWEEIEQVAVALDAARPHVAGGYDPDLYAAAYRSVLRHRQVRILPITEVVALTGSAHVPPEGAREIVPSAEEVTAAMAEVAGQSAEWIERATAEWYRT